MTSKNDGKERASEFLDTLHAHCGTRYVKEVVYNSIEARYDDDLNARWRRIASVNLYESGLDPRIIQLLIKGPLMDRRGPKALLSGIGVTKIAKKLVEKKATGTVDDFESTAGKKSPATTDPSLSSVAPFADCRYPSYQFCVVISGEFAVSEIIGNLYTLGDMKSCIDYPKDDLQKNAFVYLGVDEESPPPTYGSPIGRVKYGILEILKIKDARNWRLRGHTSFPAPKRSVCSARLATGDVQFNDFVFPMVRESGNFGCYTFSGLRVVDGSASARLCASLARDCAHDEQKIISSDCAHDEQKIISSRDRVLEIATSYDYMPLTFVRNQYMYGAEKVVACVDESSGRPMLIFLALYPDEIEGPKITLIPRISANRRWPSLPKNMYLQVEAYSAILMDALGGEFAIPQRRVPDPEVDLFARRTGDVTQQNVRATDPSTLEYLVANAPDNVPFLPAIARGFRAAFSVECYAVKAVFVATVMDVCAEICDKCGSSLKLDFYKEWLETRKTAVMRRISAERPNAVFPEGHIEIVPKPVSRSLKPDMSRSNNPIIVARLAKVVGEEESAGQDTIGTRALKFPGQYTAAGRDVIEFFCVPFVRKEPFVVTPETGDAAPATTDGLYASDLSPEEKSDLCFSDHWLPIDHPLGFITPIRPASHHDTAPGDVRGVRHITTPGDARGVRHNTTPGGESALYSTSPENSWARPIESLSLGSDINGVMRQAVRLLVSVCGMEPPHAAEYIYNTPRLRDLIFFHMFRVKSIPSGSVINGKLRTMYATGRLKEVFQELVPSAIQSYDHYAEAVTYALLYEASIVAI